MEPENLGQKAEWQLKTLQWISLALLAAVFFFPLIIEGALQSSQAKPQWHIAVWLLRLAELLSLGSLFFAGRIYRLVVSKARLRYKDDKNVEALLGSWFVATLISQVLREVPALVGIALSLISGNRNYCILLGLASFIALGLTRPKAEDLSKVLS